MGNASSGWAYVGGGGGAGSLAVSAGGGTSNNVSGLTFANSNGVSFGLSTGAGVGTITASVAGASAGVAGILASNTTYTSGSVSFSNANGITFGSSAGQAITASYNSTQFAGTATSITGSLSITQNSAGIAFNGSNLVGNNTAKSGAIAFTANSSGISINATSLAGTATAITGNASITLNTAGLSFNGSGLAGTNTGGTNATVTANSSGVSVSVAAQTNQTIGLYGSSQTTGSASSYTFDARSLSIIGAGAISVGMNSTSAGGTTTGFVISAPATSSLSATGGLSIAINASTISIGQGVVSRSIFPAAQVEPISAPGNGSLSIQYYPCDGALTATRLDALVGWVNQSTASTATMAIAMSAWAIVYTKNVSTLSSLSSGSTQTTYSYASNSAGNTQLFTGAVRPVSVPINMNFTQGEYYVGFNFSTTVSSVGLSTTSLGQTLSIYGGGQLQSASNFAEFTNQTASSTNLYGGMGIYTAATAGAPVSIGLANIAQTGASLSQANIALVFRNV